ncbi:MAG: response regulator [Clostridia bacterium]|nr:response regulator [Clostridia bacterium]
MDIAALQQMIQHSVFDFMEYADVEGMDHNITGGISDARDRQYYLDAKAGNTGVELIYNSRATHETLLMFYSPVYYHGEFAGSLVGVYQAANKITSLLQDSFFGEASLSYLANSEGRIIACSDGFDPQKEMYLTDLAQGDAKVLSALNKAMHTPGGSLIPFPGNDVGGYLTVLPDTGYFIIRIFPPKAHMAIVARSNTLVFCFVAVLMLLFAGFIIYLAQFFRDEQAELEAAMKEAENANSAKTTFLFNMSHDIRTPMNAIIGFRNLLEKHQDNPEKRAGYLRKIDDASTVLLSIINNVLEMARIEKGTLEVEEIPWSAEEFTDSLYSIFSDMMRQKNITFTQDFQAEHPYVYCDPIKQREIFTNIISNAYKYTNPGGTVHMSLRELPAEKEGWVLYRTTVTDTGLGMSEEFLPHLFEEFARENNTTDAKVEGTGLGMPIVKRLVELLNGTIEVTSVKGKGTTFTVTIPHRIADASTLVRHDDIAIDHTSFIGKRLLLAEDNDLNAEIATEILEEEGFAVIRAEDGERCLHLLEAAPAGYFALILMDIQMPNMNGYEATRAIRALPDKSKASIRILAMTANAFEEDRKNALAAGMDGHIAKPIDIKRLNEAILSVLDKK